MIDMLTVDVVIVTYNRGDCVCEAIDNCLMYDHDINKIYVIVNGSTDDTLIKLSRYSSNEKIVVISLTENLGAPAGKNVGLRKSDADIVIVIDDDAEFFTKEPIEKVRDAFATSPKLGLMQFKIVNHDLGKVMDYEFPAKNATKYQDVRFKISTFTGAGHAIRKALLDDVGYYPDSFFYAHEELDLGFRAVRSGWDMEYVPAIGIYHKKNPNGRLPEKSVIKKMLLNRMIVAHSYLPFKYKVVSNFLWFMKTAIWSKSLVTPALSVFEYFKIRGEIERKDLGEEAMYYLKNNHGRLWY